MELLRRANHIPDRLCSPTMPPILHRCYIRGGVPKPAIGFSNNKWIITQCPIPDHNGPLADLRETAFLQLLDNSRQFRIIKAFAQLAVKTDPQEIIHLRKLLG